MSRAIIVSLLGIAFQPLAICAPQPAKPLDLFTGDPAAPTLLVHPGSRPGRMREAYLQPVTLFWMAPPFPRYKRQMIYCRTHRSGSGAQAPSLSTNAVRNRYNGIVVALQQLSVHWQGEDAEMRGSSDPEANRSDGDEPEAEAAFATACSDDSTQYLSYHRNRADPRVHGPMRTLLDGWHRPPADRIPHDDSYPFVAKCLNHPDLHDSVSSERIIWLRPCRPHDSQIKIIVRAPAPKEQLGIWLAYNQDPDATKSTPKVYRYRIKNLP